ncbi:MAG: sodium:calcium antiporter [Candidatus Bipolaricaulota bacterium]|nr:sodium:calcium antiporter [Candidatus Bipolaricaulota bacterium]
MHALAWSALFLVSAAVVVRSGLALSQAGDLLAETTGLGRLWVGTILLAVATSLPELVTNLAAVRLDAPALAGGNVLGANMLNVVVLASLLSLFPTVAVARATRDQRLLVVTALALTGVVVVLVALDRPVNLGPVSLGTLLILGGYLLGMVAVYRARGVEVGELAGTAVDGPPGSAKRAWAGFGLAAAGVLVAAPVLAASADRLADILGISGSFMGVLAVAIVTTMPETSVTWGALRLGSEEMALGNVYGSCAFNVLVLALADLIYPWPLFALLDRSHLVAGLGALLMMGLGPLVLVLRTRDRLAASRLLALVILGAWIGTMLVVFSLARPG